MLGDQKNYDLSFISRQKSKQRVLEMSGGSPKIRFDKEFEGTPLFLTGILSWSLKFNPFFRPSALELLNSTELLEFSQNHFDNKSLPSPTPIRLSVDKSGEFNYEESVSPNFDIYKIRKLISEL